MGTDTGLAAGAPDVIGGPAGAAPKMGASRKAREMVGCCRLSVFFATLPATAICTGAHVCTERAPGAGVPRRSGPAARHRAGIARIQQRRHGLHFGPDRLEQFEERIGSEVAVFHFAGIMHHEGALAIAVFGAVPGEKKHHALIW